MNLEERILNIAEAPAWFDSRELRAIALDVRKMEERIKRLVDVLGKAELAVAFANREHGVIRMMADDYTEVLQQIRVALKSKEDKP